MLYISTVLVDVVQMRRQGVKLPRADLLAAVTLRAELTLSEGRPGWHADQRSAPLLAGLLLPNKSEWAIEPLDHAQVRKISNGQLIITGYQQFSPSHRDKDIRVFPQAWWCRIVPMTRN